MEWKTSPYHFKGLQKHLDRIQEKKSRLDALRPLSAAAVKSIQESLALEWIYHSNSIEGNTLTLRETQMVVKEGFTVKGKSLREHLEALNHHEAIQFVESLISDTYRLRAADVLQVHALILQKIELDFAGRYRNSGVRIAGANFVPPNAQKIDALMEELIDWTNEADPALHVLVRATIFHHRFVWIHPFFDGNGRTARLIFNVLLLKAGFPPAIILKNDRKKYYDALNQANKGNYAKLLLLVLQASERTLDIYFSHLTDTYDDYQSISDIVQEPDVPYGQEYISLLVRQGKISGLKEGRNWRTTKKEVLRYMTERERVREVRG